jgi:hypothetical protein
MIRKNTKLFCYLLIIVIFNSIFSINIQAFDNIDNNSTYYDKNSILNEESEIWLIVITVGEIERDSNNVIDLTEILLSNGYSISNILMLIEENATKNKILNEPFEWLQSNDIRDEDIVLFYFSMHGDRIEDKNPIDEPDNYDEYLVPYDYEMENNYILDEELSEKFDLLDINNLIVIFETCYSGGMLDGDSDIKKSGSIILTSCDYNESSWPKFFGNKWLFPHYLFKGLMGDADINNDHIITVEESFLYAEKLTFFRSSILAMIYSFIPFIPHQFYPQNPQIYDAWPSIEENNQELPLIYL